jgi:hypothetical protein
MMGDLHFKNPRAKSEYHTKIKVLFLASLPNPLEEFHMSQKLFLEVIKKLYQIQRKMEKVLSQTNTLKRQFRKRDVLIQHSPHSSAINQFGGTKGATTTLYINKTTRAVLKSWFTHPIFSGTSEN